MSVIINRGWKLEHKSNGLLKSPERKTEFEKKKSHKVVGVAESLTNVTRPVKYSPLPKNGLGE